MTRPWEGRCYFARPDPFTSLVQHGVTPQALQAYDQKLCVDISALVLRNRGAGPFGILGLVDEHCGSIFDNIDDVTPKAGRDEFMARYKQAVGFAIEAQMTIRCMAAPLMLKRTEAGLWSSLETDGRLGYNYPKLRSKITGKASNITRNDLSWKPQVTTGELK